MAVLQAYPAPVCVAIADGVAVSVIELGTSSATGIPRSHADGRTRRVETAKYWRPAGGAQPTVSGAVCLGGRIHTDDAKTVRNAVAAELRGELRADAIETNIGTDSDRFAVASGVLQALEG